MNDIDNILTILSKDTSINNDKLFSTMIKLYSTTDSIGKELSNDELNDINTKYGYNLLKILEENKNTVLKNLYDYMNLLNVSVDIVECWLNDWVDYDDIALFILDEDIDDYKSYIDDGYDIGDYIYEKENDNTSDGFGDGTGARRLRGEGAGSEFSRHSQHNTHGR